MERRDWKVIAVLVIVAVAAQSLIIHMELNINRNIGHGIENRQTQIMRALGVNEDAKP